MDRLIYGLLVKNNKVVVPGFGSFIMSGTGMAFDRSMIYNDGLLAEFAAEQEHTEYSEALAHIEEYAARLNEMLENNGSVIIEGIGNVEKAADGSISFLPAESAAEGKAGADTITEEEEEIVEEEEFRVQAGASPEPDEPVFVLDESGNIDLTRTEIIADIPGIISSGSEFLDAPFVIEQVQDIGSGQKEITAEAVTRQSFIPEKKQVITGNNPFPSAHRNRIALPVKIAAITTGAILIILLFIWILPGGSLSNILHRENSTAAQAGNEGQPEGTAVKPTTGNITVEEASLPETDRQPADSYPLQTAGTEKNNYYVVAGCFTDLQNAENYVIFLRQQGYNAGIIGVRKNLHAVSFDSFEKKQEALIFMQKIRQEFEPEAWVLYYRNP